LTLRGVVLPFFSGQELPVSITNLTY
jgi:hypothetical protein